MCINTNCYGLSAFVENNPGEPPSLLGVTKKASEEERNANVWVGMSVGKLISKSNWFCFPPQGCISPSPTPMEREGVHMAYNVTIQYCRVYRNKAKFGWAKYRVSSPLF